MVFLNRPIFDPDIRIAPKEDSWSILEKLEPPKLYPKNGMIYRQGETADHFYYLKSGRVRIFISSENGLEKTLTILEKNNIFGEAAFFDGLPRVSSSAALEESEIIPVNQFLLTRCFREEPMMAVNLLKFLARTIRMLSAQVDNMTFLAADRRVAQILTELSERSKTFPQSVDCSHEDLANLAGVSRVTVSRILTRFSKNGWVETRYRKITVLDSGALSRFALS